ncbi:hypothetical protein OG2516_11746 [Oceanicola granulosus HTCC2516]|uniref:Uncharacterized protein n=1 Tax=Oceanicola granulosus (strain ATCC BAA-861 / DSM 15982 / KCTC 12143 / HTCC2516) TaxID=314256 RepID=Q2CJK4_OCEGH|nr:hypothetical protein [Oceanicola granulosus]EAR53135.1 hypothetical protein OG2516_11746 [Oceanicola granulosus HTCC2516]
MRLSVHFDDASGEGRASGPVQVGWFLNTIKGGVIYDPPERVRGPEKNRSHAKSASRCPAVINMESRYFLIRCPFDLNLEFVRDKDGKPALRNLNGSMSSIRANKLRDKVHITAEHEWRYEGVPTIQVETPYVFISDEPVYMTQLSPFMHYTREPIPGTIFGGRFPINVWPRPLMWAFEWHDLERPLKINRGDPWFYAGFETRSPERPVVVSETERTPELIEYMELISGAVNYVNQTFSLFEAAEARRPEKLVSPVKRRRDG